MNKWIIILFLFTGQLNCIAGAFDADTVDNWQIYNGDSLILSGNSSANVELQTTLNYRELKDIRVVYNHCVKLRQRKMIIWATVPADKASASWTKEFILNPKGEYVIPFNEVDPKLKDRDSLTIWYNGKGDSLGTKLGAIRIVR